MTEFNLTEENGITNIRRETLMAKHQLIKAARAVIRENAAFEDMTEEHAAAMRALREAIERIDALWLTT